MKSLLMLFISVVYFTQIHGQSEEDYGLKMVRLAFKVVCWYEHLKQSPRATQKLWVECTPKSDSQVDHFLTEDKYKKNQTLKLDAFSCSMEKFMPLRVKLPEEYYACRKYFNESRSAPNSDESDILKDDMKDKNYPLKAMAYCLVETMRKKHGAKAVDAAKSEITHSKKNWKQALLERENEFRGFHGSGPLVMDAQLEKDAQAWADQEATDCRQRHIDNTDNSTRQGENLHSTNHLAMDDLESAYSSADSWYNEIDHYDWNQDKPSNMDDVGHFTQMLWKKTKKVGYGMARNEKCDPEKGPNSFVVARYLPPGNNVYPGMFKKNVLPKNY